MITEEQIRLAYEELLVADNAQFQAEEERINAVQVREDAYNNALEEARLDGITEEARQHQKAQKATRSHLTSVHLHESASRKAAHEYRQAGIKVDSLVRQMEATKLALQVD